MQPDSDDLAPVVAAVQRTVGEPGGIAAMAPIDEFSFKDFDRTFAINVRAAFVAARL